MWSLTTGAYGVGKIATVQTSKVVSLDHGYKPVKVFQMERPKDAFLQHRRFVGSMDKPPIFHAHQCVTVRCSDFLWEEEKKCAIFPQLHGKPFPTEGDRKLLSYATMEKELQCCRILAL